MHSADTAQMCRHYSRHQETAEKSKTKLLILRRLHSDGQRQTIRKSISIHKILNGDKCYRKIKNGVRRVRSVCMYACVRVLFLHREERESLTN